MSKIVIIGAGDFPKKEYPRYLVRSADRIICCDSALRTWLRVMKPLFGRDRLPDAVIGDMDSLPKTLQKRFSDRIIHITEQDDNDQTKAMRYVMDHYPDAAEIHFIGSTGKREDHTVGNMSLLMEYARIWEVTGLPAEGKPVVDMVTDYGTIFAVTESCSLPVGEGRRISIFTPDNSLRIKSKGLVWPTDDVVFDNWWKATLNRASEDTVTLELSHKSIALISLD